VEEELLQLLASQESPMENPSTTRSILALNSAHEETQERWVGSSLAWPDPIPHQGKG